MRSCCRETAHAHVRSLFAESECVIASGSRTECAIVRSPLAPARRRAPHSHRAQAYAYRRARKHTPSSKDAALIRSLVVPRPAST